MKISLNMELIFTLDAIDTAAATFISAINERNVIAFHGEMGAGKTTFVHAVCKSLKIESIISSPTFSIINEYELPGGKVIYHMDLYRLKNESEAIAAGVEDYIYSGNLCLVEWPEKAQALFPEDTVHCYFTLITDNERKLQINL